MELRFVWANVSEYRYACGRIVVLSQE